MSTCRTPNHPPSGNSRYPLGGNLNLNRNTINNSSHPHPLNPSHYFGDLLTTKQNQIFRGLSCQVGGFPVDPQDPKHKEFIFSTTRLQPDVIAIQETGINFTHAGIQGQWKS